MEGIVTERGRALLVQGGAAPPRVGTAGSTRVAQAPLTGGRIASLDVSLSRSSEVLQPNRKRKLRRVVSAPRENVRLGWRVAIRPPCGVYHRSVVRA